jgi:methionyl-tRNA formyltransferase
MDNIEILRLYLLGYKGFKVLQEIVEKSNPSIIEEVVIGSDEGVENDYSSECKYLCTKNNIKFISRKQDKSFTNTLSLAIGWRWMIDLERVPNLIVIHDSLLPKYRGFNPVVTALINGDTEIGATAIYAAPKMDAGDIVDQMKVQISYPLKILQAIELLSSLYVKMSLTIVSNTVQGVALSVKKQSNLEATYSLWRDDEDYFINWNWDSRKIRRFVDAVGYPYDWAKCWLGKSIIKICEVEEVDDVIIENRSPGKVIFIQDNHPVVVCGTGLLKIIEFQSASGESIQINSLRTRFK